MTRRRPWLSFERSGGQPPRDDESLELAEDGTFTARRTVGGQSIGAFEGTLPTGVARRLRAAVAALEAEDLEIPTPGHGATEVLAVAGKTLETGSNETPPKPWRPLLRLVRGILTDDVMEHPRAALRLVATPRAGRLEHAGTGSIDVDLASLQVRVVLMGDDDAVRDRWQSRERDASEWVTAERGWTADLPFDHGLRLGAGDWLQVRVQLAIRAGGERRAAQLYMPVIPDA